MTHDLLEQLADEPVPDRPAQLADDAHQRLNSTLVALHVLDLGLRGLPTSFAELGRAMGGLAGFSLTGRFDAPSRQHDHDGP